MSNAAPVLPSDAWWKDAVIYQVHVKSFRDADGDGVGDFRGLTETLDYIASLGVTAVWLSPFYPSPLRDDGWDIMDFTAVHPRYGTMADFKRFLREAHARDLRVITELTLNHTSQDHPWFVKARSAKPGSKAREYYLWSDDPGAFAQARVLRPEAERANWTWDPVAGAYYFHRFYAHQPDLNYDNPKVRQAMTEALDFWLDLGVDGLRLDGAPYLFKREGTDCENLPETHAFLRELRAHVDAGTPGRLLLADANQWPEDAARYFGEAATGLECHMAFHFPLMPRMFMALEMEDRHPVLDIMEQTPQPPPDGQWALFLRNHDELTLEMVTDEERDYMHRIFVHDPRARVGLGIRRRLAPLLGDDRRKIELLNVLLMTLPGSPVVYYGDELGMGDNIYLGDRDGVRTPMQWSADQNAGFSAANPQKLHLPLVIDPEYHYASLNAQTQESNPSSLLWWMRRLIALRNEHCCFGRGELRFLAPDNPKVLAFIRRIPTPGGETQQVVTAVNLSRHAQAAALDLADLQETTDGTGKADAAVEPVGATARDLFSGNPLGDVTTDPFPLTFGPYGYYLFSLERDTAAAPLRAGELPRLEADAWATLHREERPRRALEKRILPGYMRRQRWFGGKARVLQNLTILDAIHLRREASTPVVLLVQAAYQEGDPEIYLLPLAYAPRTPGDDAYELPRGSVAWLALGGDDSDASAGAMYEAVFSRRFCRDMLDVIAGRKRLATTLGRLKPVIGSYLKTLWSREDVDLKPRLLGAEQSNTSILYGNELLLKLYRRTERGLHPDVEIARHLTERAGYEHTPAFAGSLELTLEEGEGVAAAGVEASRVVLGLMQRFVPNQGDAWEMALGLVGRYLERAQVLDVAAPSRSGGSFTERADTVVAALDASRDSSAVGAVGAVGAVSAVTGAPEPPDVVRSLARVLPPPLDELLAGQTLEMVRLLGRRTGELHRALAWPEDPAFAPEPFTTLYQRALYQSVQTKARQELRQLARLAPDLPEAAREEAEVVLSLEEAIMEALHGVLTTKLEAAKIRCHGDYHLGQVLFTGRDFVIFDFEGEPARPLSERRLKRCPIKDVAGMIRSFQYAAYSGRLALAGHGDAAQLDAWADLWSDAAAVFFLAGYRPAMAGAGLVPAAPGAFEALLKPYLLEKALYEMGYELNNRPDWVRIPLRGIKQLVGATP